MIELETSWERGMRNAQALPLEHLVCLALCSLFFSGQHPGELAEVRWDSFSILSQQFDAHDLAPFVGLLV